MQDLVNAGLLGIVEGVTEYLPISSTGHLVLFGDLIGFSGPKAEFFDVFIQLGAILAVVILYFRRFLCLLELRELQIKSFGFQGMTGIAKLMVASVPALFSGALLHSAIKAHLFSSLTVACALIVGAFIMIAVERRKIEARVLSLEAITFTQAFFIGVAQCFALWPGMSRSACTIVGGLLCGLERRVAAEFSFLVAVPVMAAAVLYDTYKNYRLLEMSDIGLFAVGFVVSFITAVIAIKAFIALLQKFSLLPFAWYRIALGILVLAIMAL